MDSWEMAKIGKAYDTVETTITFVSSICLLVFGWFPYPEWFVSESL
jgi:hypothetical protein